MNKNRKSNRVPTNTPVEARQIKANTEVMCSGDDQLGVVEGMDGKNLVKLRKDANGFARQMPGIA